MSLTRFSRLDNAAEAVLAAGESLRYLRDTQGDLPWRNLHTIQDNLYNAKVASIAAIAEAERNVIGSESYIRSIGGPENITAFKQGLYNVEVAAAAWNAKLEIWRSELTTEELIKLVTRGSGVSATKHWEHVPYVVASKVDQLRQSPELTALIAAFEAVGA